MCGDIEGNMVRISVEYKSERAEIAYCAKCFHVYRPVDYIRLRLVEREYA
jgi:hypothetical protein